jgi:UPF0716 protein FxsA
MWFAAPFLIWPLVEIALFVVVGGAIGLWATLGIVLGTGVLGSLILRNAAAVVGLRGGLRDPRQMIATATKGSMTVLAGVLLILPGFLTDVLGILLLIPPVQLLVTAYLTQRIATVTRPSAHAAQAGDEVIEGDYVSIDPDTPPTTGQKPSRWTQD